MTYTVEFECGGNIYYKGVSASSKKEAINLVKQYVSSSTFFGNGRKYKVVITKEV